MDAVRIEGHSKHGMPRQDFANRLASMQDKDYLRETEQMIWLSAYARNNDRSDFHWMKTVCSEEAVRRQKPELYDIAHKRAVETCE